MSAEVSKLRDMLLAVPADERRSVIESLGEEGANAVLFDWPLWAREAQLPPPGSWTTWMIMAGRGFGKTRSGSEWIRHRVEREGARYIALVAKTPKDARDVMIEGESGILTISPPWNKPIYEPSKARLTWPNGATATVFSDEVPDALRGPQHDTAWVDEGAKFRNPQDTWDNLMFGLRLGMDPRALMTTTPRPIPIVIDLLKDKSTVVTTGSTFENLENLAPTFVQYILRKYDGTRLGQQELYAQLLADAEGALWKRAWIDESRVAEVPFRLSEMMGPDNKPVKVALLKRSVLGVDPAVTAKATSDETGLVAAAVGADGHAYVLDDRSGIYVPAAWARQAIDMFKRWDLDNIIGEVNNGGDLVENTVRTVRDENDKPIGQMIPFKSVRASRGKQVRAEPIAALYEQRRVHHVRILGPLEDEMCTWEPGVTDKSPNRIDALVWALSELMVSPDAELRVRRIGR